MSALVTSYFLFRENKRSEIRGTQSREHDQMNKDETDGSNNNSTSVQTPVPKMEVVEGGGGSSDIKDEDGVWSADIEQVWLILFFGSSSVDNLDQRRKINY